MNDRLSVDVLRAKATLLALRVGADLAAGPGRYRLGSEGPQCSDAEVLERLVSTPKPLRCAAEVVQGSLVVTLEAVTPSQNGGYAQWMVGVHALMKSVLNRYGGETEDPVVILEAAGESLILAASSLQAWLTDYEMRGVALALRAPEPRAGDARGGCIVGVTSTKRSRLWWTRL
jgi:hypothetical protein